MILPTWIVSRLYSLSQFFNTIMKTRMHYSSFKPLLYITMGNDSEKFILSSFICISDSKRENNLTKWTKKISV